MGLYLGPRRAGDLTDDPSPVVTPREYISLFSSAIRSVSRAPKGKGDGYQRGVACFAAGQPDLAVRAFARLVRLHPDDPAGHRMLGLAHLGAGNSAGGFRHLGLALKILRRDVQMANRLRESLRLQLEAGLVRLFLLPLCARSGDRAALNRLIAESWGL